jgi:DNA repair photolyase
LYIDRGGKSKHNERVIIREIEAKSILNASKIHDFCVNPYTGCGVGCLYCYARLFIPRYSGHAEPWGTFVDAKVNAPDVLRRQLKRAKPGNVWVSSVCDPYQPVEKRFGLTRRCLEALLEAGRAVLIQTKSARILADLALIRRFPDARVTFSIATEDEAIAGRFELGASPVAERIAALARLHEAGVKTAAFIGPILPGNPERLVERLAGVIDEALVDRLNYVYQVRGIYERLGLGAALTDAFFRERRERYARALARQGIPFQLLF